MNDTRVKDLLDTAVGQAPPGRYDLDAAVRSGRRRRVARTAGTVATTTAVVALVATGTLTLASQGRTTAPTVAAGSGQSASSTSPAPPATTPTPAPTHLTLAQLEALAGEVASPANGKVTVASTDETPAGQGPLTRSVRLHVTINGAGTFDVAAGLDTDPANGVATWTQSCVLDNGGRSAGRACTALTETPTQGIWSRVYDSQQGRRSLMLAATLPTGDVLTIKVDNFTEQPNGSKTVGPAWSTTGITAKTLADAAATVTTAD